MGVLTEEYQRRVEILRLYGEWGAASGQDRTLVRAIAIQVWQKHIDDIAAKLILLGITEIER